MSEINTDLMRFRYLVESAMLYSDDPRTKNAAGLFEQDAVLPRCAGANQLPSWIVSRTIPEGESKYDWLVHAEAAAIANAAFGTLSRSVSMYALWAACPSCAVLIAQAGIRKVVTLQRLYDSTPDRWKAKVDTGLRILRAAGVAVRFYDDPIGKVLLFDGAEVTL